MTGIVHKDGNSKSLKNAGGETGTLLQLANGTIAACDVVSERILGYTAEQLIGKPSFDPSWQAIHPDGSLFVPEDYPAIVALQTGQPCLNIIMGFYRPDGELVWLKLNAEPLFRVNESVPYAVLIEIAQNAAPELPLKEPNGKPPTANCATQQRNVTPTTQTLLNQSNSALQEIEAIYAMAPIGLCFLDTELRFVRINQHLADINGLSVSEHFGRTVQEVLPEMAAQLEPLYRQVIESGEPILNLEVEGTNRAQPGVQRFWLVSYYPQQDEDGRILGVNVMVQEITERKKAEVALLEMNQRILTAWESMTDMYVALDREWRIIYTNPAATQLFYQLTNLEPEEFLGKTHWEVFPWSVGQINEREYRRAVAQQVAVHFDFLYEPSQDWFEVHAYPCAEGLGIYFRNISDRKQTEASIQAANQRILTAWESMTDMYVSLDRNWRITYVNQATAALNNLSPEDMIGKTHWEMWNWSVGTIVEQNYHRSVAEQVPVHFEVLYEPLAIWLEIHAYPSTDGLSIYFRDVTDRKHAELLLVEHKQLLELIASGHPLDECLCALCASVSKLNPGTRACFLLSDAQRRTFKSSFTLDLPPSFGQGLKDAPINDLCIGTCGEAVYRGQPITCADIANDERWLQEWRDLCIAHGVLACHSKPVMGIDNLPVGSLMLCFEEARMPTDWEYQIADFGTQVASIVFERDRSLRALRESEAKYRTLFESIDEGFCICEMLFDENGEPTDYRFLEVNSAFGRLTGLEQATGKTARELVPNLEAYWFEIYGTVVRTGEPVRFENQSIVMNRWFDVNAFCIGEPQSNQFAVLFTNISDRKKAEVALLLSEERYRALTELSPQLVFMSQPDGYISYCNQWGFDFTGRSLAQLQGDGWAQCIHPDYRDRVYTTWMAATRDLSDYEIEIPFRRADGVYRWLYTRALPVTNETGAIAYWLGVALDITDRKLAEAALRESEERLILAIEGAGMATWDINMQTGRGIWSKNHFTLLGYEPVASGEATYEMWRSRVHPHDLEKVMQALEVAQQTRSALALVGRCPPASLTEPLRYRSSASRSLYCPEYRISRVDNGEVRWLSAFGRFLDTDTGDAIRFVGIFFDITERKRIEEELRQKNAILDVVNQSAPTPIFVKDRQGRIIYANPATLEVLGKSASEVIGCKDCDLYPSPELGAIVMENDRRIMESGQTEVVEESPDGIRTFLGMKSPYRNEAGEVIGLIGISNDITNRIKIETALRDSEARYRALVDAMPQVVWITSAEGQCEYVNQRFCEYTGLDESQLLNYGWLTVIHPDDRDRTREQWQASVSSGSLFDMEFRMRRFDGVYRWFLSRGTPLKNGQGQILKWFGTSTDIDDQKQIEAQRLQLMDTERAARTAAERANQIKDEFLAVVSHELRTPLNPILGWSKLLRSGKIKPEKVGDALGTIERNAQQQAQLIDDLLDVSRILRNKLTLTVAPVDLVMTITNALETVRLAAQAKSIQLHPVFSSDVGPVMGDAGRLQQIVWNLVSNAVKFTPHGGRVEVKLESYEFAVMSVQLEKNSLTQNSKFKTQNSQSFAQIQVIDTGKGIQPEFLPYLFEPFRQEDTTTTRKFGGLGLGLSIVKQLVELHGGTVRADSLGEGHGATFTVKLPIAQRPSLQPTRSFTNSEDIDLSGVHILVVDDLPDSREFVAFVLEASGATVTTADSAQAALDLLFQCHPDVLISDVGMPNLNGYQLLQQIRAGSTHATLPAIALTAYATEVDQQQALKSGFQQHLAKPIEPDALVKAVATVVAPPV